MKEFILSMMLTMGLADAPVLVGYGDFENPLQNGNTRCVLFENGSRECRVKLARERMADARPISARYTAAENTVVHELCHVVTFLRVVHTTRDAERYDHHGREWRKCAREYGVVHRNGMSPQIVEASR